MLSVKSYQVAKFRKYFTFLMMHIFGLDCVFQIFRKEMDFKTIFFDYNFLRP